jgi:methylated-DNA-[protein]-cysteine S-methyltransferase
MISIATMTYPSPVGDLSLAANQEGVLLGLFFGDIGQSSILQYLNQTYPHHIQIKNSDIFKTITFELDAYFKGNLKDFTISVSPKGTDFQMKVWKSLTTILWGETISYGELAKKVNNPKASRAVGSANGKNPISIVIPCHRVIAGDGGLGGFGGGENIKAFLLELEGSL